MHRLKGGLHRAKSAYQMLSHAASRLVGFNESDFTKHISEITTGESSRRTYAEDLIAMVVVSSWLESHFTKI